MNEVATEVLCDAPFYAVIGRRSHAFRRRASASEGFLPRASLRCMESGVHTAVETAGFYPWKLLEDVLPVTRLLMMDIKHMDPVKHRKATGVDNTLILENVRRAAGHSVPSHYSRAGDSGVNDSAREIAAIRDFARANGHPPRRRPLSLELLTFHPLALDKYQSLES